VEVVAEIIEAKGRGKYRIEVAVEVKETNRRLG
jgi:hypothetical protein